MLHHQSIRVLLFSLSWFVTSCCCSAQTAPGATQNDFPGLDIQARIGWDGFIDQSAPLPLSFLVTNHSEKLLEGELRLRDPISGRSQSLGDLAIGPGGTKRISTIQSLAYWESCFAEYTDGSQIFWTRNLSLANERTIAMGSSLLLVIDDGGRKVAFPSDKPGTDGVPLDQTIYTPPLGEGHLVQALSIGSWQIPTHPGPLTATRAAVLIETARPEVLSDAQWDAVGRWICMGGVLFVHESTPEVLKRAEKACPLTVLPAREVEGFSERKAGDGMIRTYRGQMFGGDLVTPLSLAMATSKLVRPALFRVLTLSDVNMNDAPASERTRYWVITVFGLYTLISGGVTFLMFRFNRSHLKAYTIAVVTVASVAAAFLGIMLRNSRGDAAWNTVTLLTEVGAVQAARIGVRSAGGRNFQLEVIGPKVDLQLTEFDAMYSPYDDYRYPIFFGSGRDVRFTAPPFSIRTNLSDAADAFRIQVPVTPWGRREAIAVGFLPSFSGINVRLKYEPAIVRDEKAPEIVSAEDVERIWTQSQFSEDAAVNGRWSVEIINDTPQELRNCSIVVTKSSVLGYDGSDPFNQRNGLRFSPQNGTGFNGRSASSLSREDITHQGGQLELGSVTSKKTAKLTDLLALWSNRYRNPYEPSSESLCYRGGTNAVFMATIEKSPGLQINASASDFQPTSSGNHLLVIPLGPDDLPAAWVACHDWFLKRQISREEQLRGQSNR